MTQAIRKTAPQPLAPAPFNVPLPDTATLDNGLRVVIIDDARLPLVSYRLAFLSGDSHDPADKGGVTSAMASLLTEGTASYSSKELAEKIERLGASVSAHSSDDFTVISASSLSVYSSDILQMMAELVYQPTFPEAELDLYRRNAIENLKYQRSQPSFLANEQTARILYGEHPYARIAPSPEEIENLNRENIRAFHSERLIPNNAIFIAVGDVRKEDFLNELKAHFGKWHQGEVPATNFAQPPPRDHRSLTIVDRPGSAQANIVIANLALPRDHPDYFAVTVMNQVLGAGASSRVFMNLREEKGYTYGAYTRLDTKRFAGDLEATAEVRTAVTGESLREFFYELERIRAEPVSDTELSDAKNFLTGVFPIRAETQEGLTNLVVNQELYGLPEDYLQTYRDKIAAVTAEEVRLMAEKYVRPDIASIVIVGDAAEVLRQAGSYADNVEVFDTEKRPMDIASYAFDADATPASVAGRWDLVLDFQGQTVPITLTLEQDGDSVSGEIETVLGNGRIEHGSVSGKRVTATATTEIQGQAVDFAISGLVDGDSMTGTLSAAIIPDSLSFEGKKAG